VSRRITWTAIGAVFFLAALVLGLIAAYMLAEPLFGQLQSVLLVAGGCVIAGLVAMSVPSVVDKIEERRRARANASPVSSAVAAVDQEAKQVVDYFGAMQVVATAFLFGLGAARRLRR
jgi:hypothetical protein